jgi:hypothetical protein
MRGMFVLLMGLMACSEPPTHKGVVTDRWGKPVAGVIVGYMGSADQLVSGPDGRFTLPTQAADFKVRAGKPGFIMQTVSVTGHAEGAEPVPVRFALYPNPEATGFYAVGSTSYTAVESKAVKTVGTDIRAFHGIGDIGKARVKTTKPAEFVFSSEARRSELKQLGLQLHRLKFLEQESLPGVLGETEITLNLWVADEAVAFDLAALETDNDYTIRTRALLDPGVYAFHTQGILTSKDPSALDKLPSEMRVAFPFEVR